MDQNKLAGQKVFEHDNLALDFEDDISEYRSRDIKY